MPHFSFWSWPLPFIGPVDAALSSIQAIESSIPWDDKIDKAVWRGTAWFNGPGNPQLRQNMLAVAKGKEWGDVQVLEWNNNAVNASNALRIEDFCKYKYILYTEVCRTIRFLIVFIYHRSRWLLMCFGLGSHILGPPSFPPVLQVRCPHSTNHLSLTHNSPHTALFLLFPSVILHKHLCIRESPLANQLSTNRSKHYIHQERLGRPRAGNLLAPRESRDSTGDCRETKRGYCRQRLSERRSRGLLLAGAG
jgi:hypothetical protein